MKYRLAIIAFWNKGLAAALLFLSPFLLAAQPTGEERLRFDERFFAGQSAKLRGDQEAAQAHFEALYAQDSSNATVAYELAQLYAGQEDFGRALIFARKASASQPQNQWFMLLEAALLKQMGEGEELLPLYQSLLALQPDNAEWRVERAEVFFRLERWDEALAELDTTENLMGLQEELIDLRKAIHLQKGDLKAALREQQRLIDAEPENMEYRGVLAQTYLVNGMEKKALATYRTMLAIDSLDPRPHLDLARYFQERQDFKRSLYHLKRALSSPDMALDQKIPIFLSLFEAGAQDSLLRQETLAALAALVQKENTANDPRLWALYGDFLSREGRDQEALHFFLKSLRHPEGEKFAIWEQVLLIEVQNRNFDSLIVHSASARMSFPNQPLPYLLGGLAHNALEQPEAALPLLEEGQIYALGSSRLKVEFLMQLADAHHRLDQHAESDRYFDQVLALQPNHETALNNYAYYLALRGEQLDKALAMTEKSNRLTPDSPTFLDTWAWVLYQRGDFAEAREKMETVLRLESQPSAELWYHYADILAALGESPAAREAYERALAGGAPAEEIEAKLRALP